LLALIEGSRRELSRSFVSFFGSLFVAGDAARFTFSKGGAFALFLAVGFDGNDVPDQSSPAISMQRIEFLRRYFHRDVVNHNSLVPRRVEAPPRL
jgi:hypothetical protein